MSSGNGCIYHKFLFDVGLKITDTLSTLRYKRYKKESPNPRYLKVLRISLRYLKDFYYPYEFPVIVNQMIHINVVIVTLSSSSFPIIPVYLFCIFQR